MRLILSLIFGPFWVQLLLAAALVWMGQSYSHAQRGRLAELQALAATEPPAMTRIEDWQAPGGKVTEVNLEVQLLLDHNIHLIEQTNFVTTGEAYLYPFGAVSGGDGRTVLGGLVLTEAERDRFADWAAGQVTDIGLGAETPTLSVRLEGLIDNPSEARHAKEALREQGLSLAPDFIFVAPFLEGREAGLAAAIGQSDQMGPLAVFALAAGFAALGLWKLSRRGEPRRASVAGPQPEAKAANPLRGPMSAVAPQPARPAAAQPAAAGGPVARPGGIRLRPWHGLVLAGIVVLAWQPFLLPVAVIFAFWAGMFLLSRSVMRRLSASFRRLVPARGAADPFDRLYAEARRGR